MSKDCQNCKTSCCIAWGANLRATAADLQKWGDNDADHILQHVPKIGDQLWIDADGSRAKQCPFLVLKDGTTRCSIYPEPGAIDLRPGICITYPGEKLCIAESMKTVAIKSKSSCHTLDIAVFRQVLLLFASLILVASCSSYKGIEVRPGSIADKPAEMTKVKRLEFFGLAVKDNREDIPTDAQLERINNEKVKAAEAEAKAKTSLFKIETKQSREKLKQDTAKYLSWVCFGLALAVVAMGVFTQGYKRWAIVACAFFGVGMLALLMPELLDYVKWLVVGLGLIGIFLGMSHSREWSLFRNKQPRSGSQSETPKDG